MPRASPSADPSSSPWWGTSRVLSCCSFPLRRSPAASCSPRCTASTSGSAPTRRSRTAARRASCSAAWPRTRRRSRPSTAGSWPCCAARSGPPARPYRGRAPVPLGARRSAPPPPRSRPGSRRGTPWHMLAARAAASAQALVQHCRCRRVRQRGNSVRTCGACWPSCGSCAAASDGGALQGAPAFLQWGVAVNSRFPLSYLQSGVARAVCSLDTGLGCWQAAAGTRFLRGVFLSEIKIAASLAAISAAISAQRSGNTFEIKRL
mmetsp:Transcript_66057/g.182911  ORF Transcript_66057/g.182911 Transcript_66057/m.182911 type:complete len:263 (+) Transcript_66057:1661-2449(+)